MPGHCSAGLVVVATTEAAPALTAAHLKALSGCLRAPGHWSAGLVVVAKTEAALAALSAQFKARAVMRTYQSITLGCPREAAGQVRTNVGRHFKERKKMGVYEYGGSRWGRLSPWPSTTPLPPQRLCAVPCMQHFAVAQADGLAGVGSMSVPITLYAASWLCPFAIWTTWQVPCGQPLAPTTPLQGRLLLRQAPVAVHAGGAQPSATTKC